VGKSGDNGIVTTDKINRGRILREYFQPPFLYQFIKPNNVPCLMEASQASPNQDDPDCPKTVNLLPSIDLITGMIDHQYSSYDSIQSQIWTIVGFQLVFTSIISSFWDTQYLSVAGKIFFILTFLPLLTIIIYICYFLMKKMKGQLKMDTYNDIIDLYRLSKKDQLGYLDQLFGNLKEHFENNQKRLETLTEWRLYLQLSFLHAMIAGVMFIFINFFGG
jgi:hypothetical protein